MSTVTDSPMISRMNGVVTSPAGHDRDLASPNSAVLSWTQHYFAVLRAVSRPSMGSENTPKCSKCCNGQRRRPPPSRRQTSVARSPERHSLFSHIHGLLISLLWLTTKTVLLHYALNITEVSATTICAPSTVFVAVPQSIIVHPAKESEVPNLSNAPRITWKLPSLSATIYFETLDPIGLPSRPAEPLISGSDDLAGQAVTTAPRYPTVTIPFYTSTIYRMMVATSTITSTTTQYTTMLGLVNSSSVNFSGHAFITTSPVAITTSARPSSVSFSPPATVVAQSNYWLTDDIQTEISFQMVTITTFDIITREASSKSLTISSHLVDRASDYNASSNPATAVYNTTLKLSKSVWLTSESVLINFQPTLTSPGATTVPVSSTTIDLQRASAGNQESQSPHLSNADTDMPMVLTSRCSGSMATICADVSTRDLATFLPKSNYSSPPPSSIKTSTLETTDTTSKEQRRTTMSDRPEITGSKRRATKSFSTEIRSGAANRWTSSQFDGPSNETLALQRPTSPGSSRPMPSSSGLFTPTYPSNSSQNMLATASSASGILRFSALSDRTGSTVVPDY